MKKTTSDNIVIAVTGIVVTIAIIAIGVAIINLKNQIERNSQRIEQLEIPCTEDDLRHPERSAAC